MTSPGSAARPPHAPRQAERIALRRGGLLSGAVLFTACLLSPPPDGLNDAAWRTAAVVLLMAVWWTTEAIPIAATAMIPLVLFPTLGVIDMPSASARYANDIVFLSMGGFLIAVAMERAGLHRRIALAIVALVGTRPRQLVLGFMLASAFLSMWISNTATTAMMYPIGLAIASLFRPQGRAGPFELGTCLMLGIAYAATIGGVTTLIGTPPNAVLAAVASEKLGVTIGFVDWMMVGVPVAAVFLPIGWLLLTRLLHPPGDLRGDAAAVLAEERAKLGPMSAREVVVAVVFVLTARAWIARGDKNIGGVTIPGIQSFAPWVKDSTIAMAAAVALFVIPTSLRRVEFALDWPTANRIPWGIVVLFGGGISMAHAMSETGLAAYVGGAVSELTSLPHWLVFCAVALLFLFLTEVTSNVATATMAMPIVAGAASGLGIAPLQLMATAALAVSMAFMLPVATPPNAIVIASGYVTVPQMARAGIWFNLISGALVTVAATALVPLLLG
ncbi:MAG: DASS family sodium-coupled anion symporter [Planctomycetota bacterium]|nr:DASS family sodium-coupled anion symporter [Planctomycetota bacterium]